MGLNFRIVENSPLIPNNLIESFKKDYLNSLTNKELSEKYDLSLPLVRKAINEFNLPLRNNSKKNFKYYYHNTDENKYHVVKYAKKRRLCDITLDSEKEAQEAVEYLKSNNWSEESINKVRANRKHKKFKYYHYNKKYNKYVVSKCFNGKQLHIGTFDSEYEAQEVVEYLRSNNWSKEALNNVMNKKEVK